MTTININREFDTTIELKDNALLRHSPHLFNEWDFEKNNALGLNVYKVTYGIAKKAWWIGECGHEWEAQVRLRNRGSGCPYCAPSPKTLKGYNDMWTTNPELASLLTNPEDGYKYAQFSNVKVDWKCGRCQLLIKNKTISDINTYGLSCPRCSDTISYPEKFTYCLLRQLKIEFDNQIRFKWSDNRKYDFHIPSLNTIIETHGLQHYKQTGRVEARTLKEEQENDKYKYGMALYNGIENYIEVDCRKSNFEYIKNNILNSRLNELFDLGNVNWDDLESSISRPIMSDIIELWNKNLSVKKIAKELSLSLDTVRNNLKRASKDNLCDYNTIKSKSRGHNDVTKRVIKLNLNGEYICTYENLTEAHRDVGLANSSSISASCASSNKTAGGFRWLFECI